MAGLTRFANVLAQRRSASDGRGHDVMLVLICAVALAAILVVVFRPSAPPKDSLALPDVIGKLLDQTNDVRRRGEGTLVWSDIRRGDAVRDGDGIYVGDGGAATVALRGGAQITIDDRSLVVLRPMRSVMPNPVSLPEASALAIDLVRGGAAGFATSGPVAIHARGAAVQVERGGRAVVRLHNDQSVTVSVPAGSASVQLASGHRTTIAALQRRRVDVARDRFGPVEAMGAELVMPGPTARVYVHAPAAQPVQFAWQDVPHTGAYVLEISRSADFATLVSQQHSGRNSAEVPRLAGGVYYWRVRLRDGRQEKVSEERQLVVIDDTPAVPFRPYAGETIDLVREPNVALAWVEVPGVQHYLVELHGTADAGEGFGAEVVMHADRASQLIAAQSGLLHEGHYCFRVRADERERGESPWSQQSCFRVLTKPVLKAPKLLAPQIHAPETKPIHGWLWRLVGGVAHAAEAEKSPQSVVLRWEQVVGAARYKIEVAEDNAFTHSVAHLQAPDNAVRWQPPALRDYYWRVWAVDAEGREGDVSETRPLILVGKPPELMEPADDTSLAATAVWPSAALTWQGRGPADDFIVEVAKDSAFLHGLVTSVAVQGKSQVSVPINGMGTFYWRVVQRLADGQRGPISPTRRFRVHPAAPDDLRPRGGEVSRKDTAINLRWSGRMGVQSYELQLSEDPHFRQGVTLTSPTASLRWLADHVGSFQWRVRTRGPTSSWSAAAGIVVQAPPPSAPLANLTVTPKPVSVVAAPSPSSAPPPAPPSVGWAGLRVGMLSNLGPIVSPQLGAEIAWRTVLFQQHVGARLVASYHTAVATAEDLTGAARLTAHLYAWPLDLQAVYVWPGTWFDLTVAAGVRGAPVYTTVRLTGQAPGAALAWVYGGIAALGAESALGPGTAFGEVSYGLTTHTGGAVDADAGGIAMTLGYRVGLF